MSTIADLKTLLSHRDPAQSVVVDVDPTTIWTAPASELQNALGVVYVPPEIILYQATVTDWLNVRSGPGISNPLVGKYAPETVVDVLSDAPQTANGLTWWKTHHTGTPSVVGWAANKWLQRIQPPAPKTAHLVGLHVLQDGLKPVEQFLAALPANTILPSATVLNEGGIAALLAQRTKYVIFRSTTGDPNVDDPQIPDDPVAADSYVRHWVAALMERGGIGGLDQNPDNNIYIQPWSEVKWRPSHNAAWLAAMQTIERYGFKAAICAYAVGQPEPNEWQTLQPALEYAKTHNHIVVLHCYCAAGTPIGQLSADGPDYELRFVRLYNAVPESARPTLVISEFAHEFTRGKFEGADALITTAKLYRDAIAPYPYVGGFNLYTVGKLGGWDSSSIDSALTDPNVIGMFK